jgi:hypothetical protein
MSCFNNCYLPKPPRAWSRVQNSCSINTDGLSLLPLGQKMEMLNKGNVLQYKANSSNLTKSQKYSKIAKGQWVNRNTTWATQSTRGYTNPNTTSLKRTENAINIAIDPITGAIIGPTTEPVTCPKPIINVNEGLPPNEGGGGETEPEIPPPVEPTPESDVFPPIISDTPTEPIVIQDGGNLICSIQENICTGETKRSLSQQLCHPTTDSDVPGQIQELCWNDGTQTWYPRQRYVMTNSANKWPTNAELLGAIQINSPVIISVSSNKNIVTLTWILNSSCLPASNFNIFQDSILVKVVPGNVFTTTLTVINNCYTYEYYIIAQNTTAKTISEASNIVSIQVAISVEPPTNLSYTSIGSGSIQLTWNLPNPNCKSAVSYNIYQNGIIIDNTVLLNLSVTGLLNCSSYTFFVTSLDSEGNESSPAVLNNVIPLWPIPPSNLTASWLTNNSHEITITWSDPNPNCSPPTSYNLYYSTDNIIFNVITGILSSPYQFIPTSYNTYYFYMTSVNNLGESNNSSTVTASIILYTISGGSYVQTSSTSGSTTTYNIVINPGISTLIFNVLPDLSFTNFQLIGGGGGGGGCWANINTFILYSGAGGGGGGNLLVNEYIVSVTNPYTITVGNGGLYGLSNDGFGDNTQTAGGSGQNSSITDILTSLNIIAYGGAGGGSGTSSSKSTGGIGGSYVSSAGGSGGLGGTGGNGNGGSSGDWKTGTSGTNGYFYNNQLLDYSLSYAYPTYYRPAVPNYPAATNPDSITLTNWYTVSGGGGAGNSDDSTQFVSGNGGSGAGSGGLDGSNWSTLIPITDPPPYASFGGGGGGGGYITPAFPGGNGLVVIWFSYTI